MQRKNPKRKEQSENKDLISLEMKYYGVIDEKKGRELSHSALRRLLNKCKMN